MLRVEAIRDIERPVVLECFAGKSRLWEEVVKRTGRDVRITRIEKERGKCPRHHLSGDNIKFVMGMDLSVFDIIDLDAYGIPSGLIDIIEKKGFSGALIITAIQSMHGKLPNDMLNALGYSDEMIRKVPSLFNQNGLDKFLDYCYIKRMRKASGFFLGKKYYFITKMEA